ncbi:MAG: hypothetical protein N2C14_24040 [Planctomycetales bacterium]
MSPGEKTSFPVLANSLARIVVLSVRCLFRFRRSEDRQLATWVFALSRTPAVALPPGELSVKLRALTIALTIARKATVAPSTAPSIADAVAMDGRFSISPAVAIAISSTVGISAAPSVPLAITSTVTVAVAKTGTVAIVAVFHDAGIKLRGIEVAPVGGFDVAATFLQPIGEDQARGFIIRSGGDLGTEGAFNIHDGQDNAWGTSIKQRHPGEFADSR